SGRSAVSPTTALTKSSAFKRPSRSSASGVLSRCSCLRSSALGEADDSSSAIRSSAASCSWSLGRSLTAAEYPPRKRRSPARPPGPSRTGALVDRGPTGGRVPSQLQFLLQPLERAAEQQVDRVLGPPHLFADLLRRHALDLGHHDDLAVVLRQLLHRLREQEQPVLAVGGGHRPGAPVREG